MPVDSSLNAWITNDTSMNEWKNGTTWFQQQQQQPLLTPSNLQEVETYIALSSTYSSLQKENKFLTNNINANGKNYLTNNRETFYQSQQTDNLNSWYSFLWFIYMFFFVFYIFLALFVDVNESNFNLIVSILFFGSFPLINTTLSEIVLSGYLSSQQLNYANENLNMQSSGSVKEYIS